MTLAATIEQLIDYCQRHDWAGYDPYDALNSPLFGSTPLARSKACRLVAIQALKRSPVNLRPLLRIPTAQNPKGLALCVSALCRLRRVGGPGGGIRLGPLVDRLAALRSNHPRHWCWGYSFPWQTRGELVPRFAPNVVCTTFVGQALLDAYEIERNPKHLDMAASAAAFMADDLFWRERDGAAGFSYPSPPAHSRVHNANLLAAAFLLRVNSFTGDSRLVETALDVARTAVSAQHVDGSWPYGASPTQRWIDNFHTGYNLCALEAIGRFARTTEFDAPLNRGAAFYRRHFFNADGSPRYFHDRPHPIDIHSVAQSIITLVSVPDSAGDGTALANGVYEWAVARMWHTDGYFYYRVHRFTTNKISYMRWSQAWMLLALATLLAKRPESMAA